MIIVIAGTMKQFDDFLKREGTSKMDPECPYRFASINNILGNDVTEIVEYGTCYERKDYMELKRLANSRLKK